MNKDVATKLTMIMVLTFIFAFLSACSPSSNELSRTEAKKITISVGDYPREKAIPLKTGTFEASSYAYRSYQAHAKDLTEAGLAIVSVVNVGFEINLTDEGAKYVKLMSEPGMRRCVSSPDQSCVIVEICNVGDVTGIAYLNEGKTLAKVEYTEVCEPTPFGTHDWTGQSKVDQYGKHWTGRYGPVPKVLESSLVLQRYDDGWRKSQSF